jgi:type I restriction enzyme R subunit
VAKKEAQARIRINRLLEQAGWRFFPDKNGPDNIICESRITQKIYAPSTDFGNDFEKVTHGFVDYLLLNLDRKPVGLVEAKREGIDPLDAKQQARDYAKSLGIRHIFLSNGVVHYYWDLTQGNPTRISHLLSLEQLGEASRWNPDPQKLIETKVDENYIAVSQDAGWLNHTPAQRDIVRVNQNIKLLRDYQLDAVVALVKAYAKGKNRFLFEMATGTGKTLLSAAIVKLFIRSANATRVLFLVDRIELENQAWRNFVRYLAKDSISTVIYKERRDDWAGAQVVITTIQSLAAGNRYLTEFSPNDFQLIISDEAHRTIGGNNRVIFEYFIGAKLELTATPKNYLKGIDPAKTREDDPRELERRLLLDSYRTFGCDDGNPLLVSVS